MNWLKQNWFKLAIVIILALLIWRLDNVRVNMNIYHKGYIENKSPLGLPGL